MISWFLPTLPQLYYDPGMYPDLRERAAKLHISRDHLPIQMTLTTEEYSEAEMYPSLQTIHFPLRMLTEISQPERHQTTPGRPRSGGCTNPHQRAPWPSKLLPGGSWRAQAQGRMERGSLVCFPSTQQPAAHRLPQHEGASRN